MVNCGFYEGIHTKTALQILENWCDKIGISWGGGLGIGGGGAMEQMLGMINSKGPMAEIGKGITRLAEQIKTSKIDKNNYVQIIFPRFLYQLCGQLGWRSMIKQNGLSKADLNRKI